MSTERRNLKWMLVILFLGGVLSTTWNVEYQEQQICAVKGSSVVIFCTFSYPAKAAVQSVKWGHERYNLFDGPFIYDSELNNSSSRFLYIGDKKDNCSFKILNVKPNDMGKYAFRFVTSGSKNGKFTGVDGSRLHVVDLKVNMRKQTTSDTIKEGDSLNLTCSKSCSGGPFSSTFTWLKDGEPFNKGPEIYFRNVSFINSGNYSCSLEAHNETHSEILHIDVEYGPKNTSASATISEEVDAGSNVTLICSSKANPPVKNFTWYKMDNNTITVVGDQPELNFKELFLTDEGQYFCTATNKHGSQNSSVVTLKYKENWTTKYRNTLIIAVSVAMLLIATTVVTIKRGCNKRTTATKEPSLNMCSETKGDLDTENTEYANWPMFDTSRSQKKSRCESEVTYAVAVPPKKMDMEKQMDSHDDEECVIYSTVCRVQTSNP